MKIATWNVNSIRVRQKHVAAWLEAEQPDVLCLQELKVTSDAFPALAFDALGYRATVLGQKTYNGVAILSRSAPSDVALGIQDEVDDPQARLVGANIAGLYIFSAYFPNGGEVGSDKYAYKLEWITRLKNYLSKHFNWDSDHVVLTGDYNVAPYDDDAQNIDQWRKGVLANDEVRNKLNELKELGFVDAVRPFFPKGRIYSWWDYRGGGFQRNNGLRIDHIWASPALADKVIGARVDKAERGKDNPSDHVPVVVELEL